MGPFAWANRGIRRYTWFDVKMLQISGGAVALLIAKLWPPLLSLRWYCYVAIAAVAAIRPVYRLFAAKE